MTPWLRHFNCDYKISLFSLNDPLWFQIVYDFVADDSLGGLASVIRKMSQLLN
jgi:hypothetical protein